MDGTQSMPDINFEELRQAIAGAAREAFTALRAGHPDERFYAFALYTDDYAMTVCPSANTVEGFDRCVARYTADQEFMASLAEDGITREALLSGLRWGTAERAYESKGGDAFRGVYDLLNPGAPAPHGRSDADMRKFKGRVFAAMVLGLEDLAAQGFFRPKGAGEQITLLCSVSDSASAVWVERESARRLNPSDVYRAFWDERTRDPVISRGARVHQFLTGWLDGTHRAFTRHLRTGTA
jgi:hypothetical protein